MAAAAGTVKTEHMVKHLAAVQAAGQPGLGSHTKQPGSMSHAVPAAQHAVRGEQHLREHLAAHQAKLAAMGVDPAHLAAHTVMVFPAVAPPLAVSAPRPPFAHRLRIYVMMIGYIFSIKVPRFAINSLVPFIVAQYGMPPAAVASLLAAFHPGYVASMVPGGGATVRWGSKPVIQMGILGTAGSLALMPLAGKLGSPALMLSAVMVFMGLTQGPMSPGLGQMSRDWMPSGGGSEQVGISISTKSTMFDIKPIILGLY